MRRGWWIVVACTALAAACTSESAQPPASSRVTGTTANRTVRGPVGIDGNTLQLGENITRPLSSLYLVRDGQRQVIADPSTVATVSVTPAGTAVRVELKPNDPTGVTAWGAVFDTTEDEAIYGLTERIVDDYAASEILPEEVGSLNRKGEKVTMYIRPTMSGYAPFFQSSKGYGLLVDGTMPGTYDLGATDKTKLQFEFELDPTTKAGVFFVFPGSYAEILSGYTGQTGRAGVPPDDVFKTWRGRDEYRKGATAQWHGIEINADVARDLNAYETYGIDKGIFHFDRPWAAGQEGYGELRFDPERFPNAAAMLAEMQRVGWKMEVWVSPWAIGALGEEAKANGLLAPNSPRAIDVTSTKARSWLVEKFGEFLTGPEGKYIDGFFLDRGDEADVSSTANDVYADGRNGRQMHNAYPVAFQTVMYQVINEHRPHTGWLIARAGYTGSQAFVMRWGGDTPSRLGVTIPEVPSDTPSTDKGLRSVLISMQRAAFMGTPFWGSDIGGYSQWNDRDLYARWIEVGAASPLMRFHGQGPAPWDVNPDGTVDEELLKIYELYSGVHRMLQPYLQRLAREASETGMTLVRPLVFAWPDQPEARDRWDEWMLGPDVLVAPVWRSGDRSRSVWFPPGRWIDYWDHGTVIEGPTERRVDVPLDRLPLYLRDGGDIRDLSPPTSLLPG